MLVGIYGAHCVKVLLDVRDVGRVKGGEVAVNALVEFADCVASLAQRYAESVVGNLRLEFGGLLSERELLVAQVYEFLDQLGVSRQFAR